MSEQAGLPEFSPKAMRHFTQVTGDTSAALADASRSARSRRARSILVPLGGIGEAVTNTTIGADIPWIGGIVTKFLSQVAHEISQVCYLADMLGAPYVMKQAGVGDWQAGLSHQLVEQFEFFW